MQLALYNTRKWREENPKLFKAVYAALEEAMEIINADKRAAAELYVRIENSKLPVDFVPEIVSKPEIVFTTTPQRTDRKSTRRYSSHYCDARIPCSSWKTKKELKQTEEAGTSF